MGLRDTLLNRVIIPRVQRATPEASGKVARVAFGKALDGIGPLRPAAVYADARLQKANGNVREAIAGIISDHTKLAAVEGFATNIGGLASKVATIPANVVGIAILQCRMVAAIAHLRGYDLGDDRVRTAVFATILGSKAVRKLLAEDRIPSRPRDIATGPPIDEKTANQIGAAVIGEIIARAAGRSTASFIGRSIPGLAGIIGGATDGWTTRQVGRYASKEHGPTL
ncbi:EcsC family protein [Cumulibacter soli]|uniref:EcsC family protein n=1 Tax=Cumulibacter soli TaxID=2546344 RepID=UPI0010678474|nr:EcsC family protein [Cumulibacter soli]